MAIIYLRGFNTAREQAVGIAESLKLEQKGYTEGVYNQAATIQTEGAIIMNSENAEQTKPVPLDCALGGKLTNREKWLMRRAWVEGWDIGSSHDPITGMDDWLEERAADGVTVEMVLAKDAPQRVTR